MVGAEGEAFEDGSIGRCDEGGEEVESRETRVGRGERFQDEVGVARLLALVELSTDEGDSTLLSVRQSALVSLRGSRSFLLGLLLPLLRVEPTLDSSLVGPFAVPPLPRALPSSTSGFGSRFVGRSVGGGFATEDGRGEGEGAETDRVGFERGAGRGEEGEEGGRVEDVSEESLLAWLCGAG